jgi:hypothetical protein
MGATFSIYGGYLRGLPGATVVFDHGSASHDLLTSCVQHTYVAGPSANFDWFLLRNPELISIPSGFLCGSVGT